MSNVFLYNMPAGIPGMINRVGGRGPDVETQIMDPTHPLTQYGLFGFIDATSGDFRQMATGDASTYGLLARPYPSQATTAAGYSGQQLLGTATPPPTSGPISVLKSGYMTVLLLGATAAVKNGQVWTRINGGVPGSVYAADGGGGNYLSVAGAYFMGPADANGNVEIGFNI